MTLANQGIIVALVPAHDEETSIGATLDSLRAQELPTARIIVVADNCSDATARIALEHEAEVFETTGNRSKKAGALNQALASLIPELPDDARVLVIDADSSIAPEFLALAVSELTAGAGAVGGVFYGKLASGSLLERLQRAEYVRYARQVSRNGSRAYVLTGTATVFPVSVLREVAAGRLDGTLPPGPGAYYDEHTMTEDSYMTFAVKSLGYRTPSPAGCWVQTEVMPTWRQLWKQRCRWQLGALENLRAFGWLTPVTRGYTARQVIAVAELLFFLAYVSTSAWSAATGTYRIVPAWMAIGVLFWLERVISVRKAGPLAMLVAAAGILELGYGLFLKAVNVRCYVTAVRNRQVPWA